MILTPWIDALAEAARDLGAALASFWRLEVWPVLLTLGFFLALAAPILLVIAVLWYLDSIGWQARPGFYTIGALAAAWRPA